MSQQFGHVDFINIGEMQQNFAVPLDQNPAVAFGPIVGIEFIGNMPILGPAVTVAFSAKNRIQTGSNSTVAQLTFNEAGIGLPVTTNVIAYGDKAELIAGKVIASGNNNTTTLTPLTQISPTGITNLEGSSFRVVNITSNVNLPATHAGAFYTNIGATGVHSINLPGGLSNNFAFSVMVHNHPLNIVPASTQRFFVSGSGAFKALGAPVLLHGSGTSVMFVHSSGLIRPFFQRGTIT